MDMHARYIEVCRGIQNRLSDLLERRGMLDTICRRGIEEDYRDRQRNSWKYVWDTYTKMFPRTPDTGASHE